MHQGDLSSSSAPEYAIFENFLILCFPLYFLQIGCGRNEHIYAERLFCEELVFTSRVNARGMGFRDLQSFNLAMLSKHIWRLLNKPDSLCAQILRAKYYPHVDLLKAGPKNGSSLHGRVEVTYGELDWVHR
jgi:hypothetical protein